MPVGRGRRLWRSEPVLVAATALLAAGIVASFLARPLDVVSRLWRSQRARLLVGVAALAAAAILLAYLVVR